MKRTLALLVAVLLLPPLTSQASEVPECPPGTVHIVPLCLTEAEWQAYWSPPPQSVAPTPVYVDPVERWRPLVAKYWAADLVPWAMAILRCESGGNEWAKNRRSTAAGLFQFLRSTWDKGPAPALGLPSYWTGAPYVAEWNIQAAAWLYQNWGGKSQWSCKA